MSHFTVLVSVAAERLKGRDVESVVADMLEPYNENPEDSRYIEFVDEEDELRRRYATEATDRIRLDDGSLVLPWDERFRKPGVIGLSSDSHAVPDHLERVNVPFRETYSTFEAFAKDWCGHSGPQKNGRYGHYANPNGHWDWYEIGGRWSGFFPLTAHRRDGARTDDVAQAWEIDEVHVEATRIERRDTFLREYTALLDGKEFGAFEGPRDMALRTGLLRVERGPAVASPGEVVMPWARHSHITDERRNWCDVAKVVTAETLGATYGRCFYPLVTYAAVDVDGRWHAPGKMGWFACSDDTPETYLAWCDGFVQRFIAEADPATTLVLVDCHV